MKRIKSFTVMCLVVGCFLARVSMSYAIKAAVFPPDKSVVNESDFPLIVKAEKKLAQGTISLQINQQKKTLTVIDNLAYIQLKLKEGENKLVISQDGEAAQEINYIFQSADKPVPGGYTVFLFHDVFLDGSCGDCHDMNLKPFDIGNLIISEEAISLCLECHDDRIQAKYIHGPVGMGVCTPCHDPHESSRASLLKTTGNTICYNCHEPERISPHLDKLKADGIMKGNCLDCHDPHGTDKKFHLK